MNKGNWMWFNARVTKERFCISSLSQFRWREPTHLVGIHDLAVANGKAMAYAKHVWQPQRQVNYMVTFNKNDFKHAGDGRYLKDRDISSETWKGVQES